MEERLFYIRLAATNYLRVERLKRDMEDDVYRHQGAVPNIFLLILHFVQKLASNDDFYIVVRQIENLESYSGSCLIYSSTAPAKPSKDFRRFIGVGQ